MKFRKKPVVIEAVQLLIDSFEEVESFVGCTSMNRHYINERDFLNKTNPVGLFIETLEGNMLASVGDYVIKGVSGEFYPCKPDIFAATYDLVCDHDDYQGN